MSNETPARLLAAVLRVVAFDEFAGIVQDGDDDYAVALNLRDGVTLLRLSPKSKDDLARVVAMLGPGQLERFNTRLWIEVREPMAASVKAADIITAPASTWLAAIVAATGVGA